MLFNNSIISVRRMAAKEAEGTGAQLELHLHARQRAAAGCRCTPRLDRAAAASTAIASTSAQGFLPEPHAQWRTRLCGVLPLCTYLSAPFVNGLSTHFTVTISVTNGPLVTVRIGHEAQRGLAHRTGYGTAAAMDMACVLRVPVREPRLSI